MKEDKKIKKLFREMKEHEELLRWWRYEPEEETWVVTSSNSADYSHVVGVRDLQVLPGIPEKL